jgi:hypothetical protein
MLSILLVLSDTERCRWRTKRRLLWGDDQAVSESAFGDGEELKWS